jgi:hypothetical protein
VLRRPQSLTFFFAMMMAIIVVAMQGLELFLERGTVAS